MRERVWIVESGEYENRSVYFVATSPQAALTYLKRKRPETEWELTDHVQSAPPEVKHPFTPYREVFISKSGDKSDDRYELSEVDFQAWA